VGEWSDNPWDNDAAADWFGNLMHSTRLRNAWCEGMRADPDDDKGEIRYAASWLFVQLGRIYVWPMETFEADLELTIRVLEELRSNPRLSESDPDSWKARMDDYIGELEKRRPVAR